MGNSIVFSAVRTNANNKVLERDENGYYKVILGAINSFNSNGDFYLAEGVRDLIDNQSSILARRIKNGYLKGEVGHPPFANGMTKSQFYARNLKIELNNASHHIREVILTPTEEPSGLPGGGNIIVIEGWVKPTGIKGEALKRDLDDPEINVAFSIRCFTKDETISGVNRKNILQIITWDWVLEPGIARANKWTKLSMESNDICEIDLSEIAEGDNISDCFNCSLESSEDKEITKELIGHFKNNDSVNILKKW